MSLEPLAVIVGVGARTPLGLDAIQTGLVHRTGIPAIEAAPIFDDVAMCFQPAVSAGVQGAERAAELAAPALEEVLAALPGGPGRVHLALCLDAVHAEGGPHGPVAGRLWRRLLQSFPKAVVEVHGNDEAGAFQALTKAIASLRAGTLDLAIIGGVHTDFDRDVIARLADEGRLCKADSVDGKLPGEAASFVVLASTESARRMRLAERGSVVGLGSAREPARLDNDEPAAAARGLTKAVHDATAGLEAAGLRAGWMLTDLGFEQHRLLEWQTVLVRANQSLGAPYHIDMPAQRMGALGAAALPLMMLLASEAWQGGYAPSAYALLCAGSDDGFRGAAVLSAQ
jgi:3-oxoacyl-[acyl-carrier-protein] synthase-1